MQPIVLKRTRRRYPLASLWTLAYYQVHSRILTAAARQTPTNMYETQCRQHGIIYELAQLRPSMPFSRVWNMLNPCVIA
ncbi:hypothetical protein EDB19DRAFT_1717548, partial [Suillus lakei]